MAFRFKVFGFEDGTRFVVPGFGYDTSKPDDSPGWKIALGCFMMECVTYSNMEDGWLECAIDEDGAIDLRHMPVKFPNWVNKDQPIDVLIFAGPKFERTNPWGPKPTQFDFSVLTRRQ